MRTVSTALFFFLFFVLIIFSGCKEAAPGIEIEKAGEVIPQAESCGEQECAEGMACVGGKCIGCISDLECGTGKICCNGICNEGNCCSSDDCGSRICVEGYCAPCEIDEQCKDGLCCGGLCRQAECCGDEDCEEGKLCRSGKCRDCLSDADCGDGLECCEGTCVEECGLIDRGYCAENMDCEQFGEGFGCWDGICVSAELIMLAGTVPCDPNVPDPCAHGMVCCNGFCYPGECCDDSECVHPLQCLMYACQECSSNAMCGSGEVCCGGRCMPGNCCTGTPCSGGLICINYQCTGCTDDSECGDGRKCCNDRCVVGDCCNDDDCGEYICVGNSCRTCLSHQACTDGLCCGGACVENAECCTRNDCPAGQVCSGINECENCTADVDCGFNQKCCEGICVSGNCCSTEADCEPGMVCSPNNYCGGCTHHEQCETGQMCCSGRCVNGSCCVNADCVGGSGICTGYSCEPCQTDSECGTGRRCCEDPVTLEKGCHSGTCCSNEDCNGLVCLGNVCVRCTGDAQCGAGGKCCNGACYYGIECCDHYDCDFGTSCIDGICTGCTSDDDCGSLKCCTEIGDGRCLPFCSTVVTHSNRPGFDLGIYEGTTAAGNEEFHVDCVEDVLCWDGDDITVSINYIWVPATNEGVLYRYHLETGGQSGPYNTGVNPAWPAENGDAAGTPTRVVVNPVHERVWVTNRGTGVGPQPGSGVARFDYSGNMECYAGISGSARALAVDRGGNAWVGSYNDGTMHKISGTETQGTSDPPLCVILDTVDIPGMPYDAEVDNQGILWVQDGAGTVSMIDVNSRQFVGEYDSQVVQDGGLTADPDYVWVSSGNDGTVSRIRKSDGAVEVMSLGAGQSPRGIISSLEGYVYAGLGSDGSVVEINRTTGDSRTIDVNQGHTVTAALDSKGRLWAIDRQGGIDRVDLSTDEVMHIPGTDVQDVFGDLTGQQMRDAALSPGIWRYIYDSQHTLPNWKEYDVGANVPDGTSVAVRFRTAHLRSGLRNAAFTDYYTDFPVDLTGLDKRRFIEVEVRLEIGYDISNVSEHNAPNVFISVDESGSMGAHDGTGQTRTQRVKEGLHQMVDILGADLRIGLGGFPGSGGDVCGQGGSRMILNIGWNTEQEIRNAIDQITLGGWTPMHRPVIDVWEHGTLDDPDDPLDGTREKVLVLIGDGFPNQCSCVTLAGENCYDAMERLIDHLYVTYGIRTFIVGFAFNTDVFNRFAIAGRTDNPNDPDNYYFQATSGAELASVFETIASQLIVPVSPVVNWVSLEWSPF